MKALILGGVLWSVGAFAQDGQTLKYTPSPESDLERPVATEIALSTQGSNYALQITFDRQPWGEECRTRCANATFFLDTDGNPATGLKLGKEVAESGADVAVTVQGVREYAGPVATPALRAKIRKLSGSTVDDALIAEYDHRRDTERLQIEDDRVFVLVDATSTSIPAGSKVRMIYHPPGSGPLELTAPGLRAGKGARVTVGQERRKKK